MNIKKIFESERAKSEREYKARYARLDPISQELVETAADNLNSGTHTVADLTAIVSRRYELYAQKGFGFSDVPWGGQVIWRASLKTAENNSDEPFGRRTIEG